MVGLDVDAVAAALAHAVAKAAVDDEVVQAAGPLHGKAGNQQRIRRLVRLGVGVVADDLHGLRLIGTSQLQLGHKLRALDTTQGSGFDANLRAGQRHHITRRAGDGALWQAGVLGIGQQQA